MATITLKDIPQNIHKALKQRAKRNGRSLNREVLAILVSSVMPRKVDVDAYLVEIRQYRESLPGRLTDDLLEEAKRTGRP
ncbi:MAG: Arc family DNA-binding protein [Proteobacteria bacterium]|nr:MAG: Arc family DNA-binding protein [Pseudomonadota bacterium]